MKKQIRIWLVFAFAVLCLTVVSCSENGSEGERSYSIYVDSESSIRVEDLTVHQWAELDNQTATEQQVTDGYFVEILLVCLRGSV